MPGTEKSSLAPREAVRVTRHQIPRHGSIPNTAIQHKPLTIYHGVFQPSNLTASHIESHLEGIGVCIPQWRYTMFDKTHYHSNTHELLVIASGHGRLLFGGEENPERVEVEVSKGDAILVPAGVGHRQLQTSTNFEMVGSYPAGVKNWDLHFGQEDDAGVEDRIRKLGWFEEDPIYGGDGPALSE